MLCLGQIVKFLGDVAYMRPPVQGKNRIVTKEKQISHKVVARLILVVDKALPELSPTAVQACLNAAIKGILSHNLFRSSDAVI